MDVMDLLAIGLTFGVIVIIVMRDIETASHRERERRFDAASAVAGGPSGLASVDGTISERESFWAGPGAGDAGAAVARTGVAPEGDHADAAVGNDRVDGPDADGADDPVDEFPIEAIEASVRGASVADGDATDIDLEPDRSVRADSAVPGAGDAAVTVAAADADDAGPDAVGADGDHVASGEVVIDEAAVVGLIPGAPEGEDAAGIVRAEDAATDRPADTGGQEAVSRPVASATTS